MVKQLRTAAYFLTLSFANLKLEELLYIINKLNNLGISDKRLKNQVDKNGVICTIITQYLWPDISSINLKHFSEKSFLMDQWKKQSIMLYV